MTEIKLDVVDAISEMIQHIQNDKKKIAEITEWMGNKHNISSGRVRKILNDCYTLEDEHIDEKEVVLFVEQFFAKTGLSSINPRNWYSEDEIKNAHSYKLQKRSVVTLPHKLKALKKPDGSYSANISIRTIASWIDSGILYYNPEIQRESTIEVRRSGVRERPTVNRKNVDEMKYLLLNGELTSTAITFNALPLSAGELDEFIYDESKLELIISKGTRLDVLDGYHRVLASIAALHEDPELDFEFTLILTNISTPEAQNFQSQIAKATQISKSRAKELAAAHSDRVISMLKADSELKNKITYKNNINYKKGELVSYEVLRGAIEREFTIQTRVEATEVADYLKTFFDNLLASNSDFLLYNSTSKISLMKMNKMFSGYVALAAKMMDEKIDPNEVGRIVQDIDFSRTNPLWTEIGFIGKDGRVSERNAEQAASTFFKGLGVSVR